MKKIGKATTIKGQWFPAGSNIIVSIQGIHLNPLVWDNPLMFDPERFSPENIKQVHPLAFIPFSAGHNWTNIRYEYLKNTSFQYSAKISY